MWWPTLAIDRWSRQSPGPADARVALTVEETHGLKIHAVTPAAALAGARAGMRLTDARALDPGLKAVPADIGGDGAFAARLARWSSRWSPLVALDGADGLIIDTSGVAHLFGGEVGLVGDVHKRFAALGLATRAAIAPTPRAAWALSHYGPSASVLCPEGRAAAMLAPLPVSALRLGPEVNRTLQRLGLRTIGALAGIERKPLARRFREADNPLDAIDRALGRKSEPVVAVSEAMPPRAALRLAEPVAHPEAAPQAIDQLVPALARELEARKLGVRRLVLAGYRVDGEVATVFAGCSLPTRDPGHLRRLLADKAASLDPGFGFDGFALEAVWCEPLGAAQDGLIGGPPPGLAVARLIDRLSVRLGAERVRRPQPRASHLPERASGWRPALAEEQACMTPPVQAARPQRLFDRAEAIAVIYATPEGLPRRFVWRRKVHDIVRAEGPERIAPEWWRERSTARARDYYRVEDSAGCRFWIYREGRHGDGRGGDPNWYVHGLFG